MVLGTLCLVLGGMARNKLKAQMTKPRVRDQKSDKALTPQPRISHRCHSCGAAIRERAMFCPECGQPLSTASKAAEPEAVAQASASPPIEKSPTDEPLAEASPVSSHPPEQPSAPSAETKAPESSTSDEAKKTKPRIASTSHPGTVERTREKLHRASSVARGAIEENVKRVDKIRHVSTAMIEEASYDPSMRFVLVALALFVVFVILLVLSKVMG